MYFLLQIAISPASHVSFRGREFLLGLDKICKKNVQNITPRLITNKNHSPVQSPSRGLHEVFVNAFGVDPGSLNFTDFGVVSFDVSGRDLSHTPMKSNVTIRKQSI